MDYSIKEAAGLLDMTDEGVRAAIRRGRLTTLPNRRPARITDEAITRYRDDNMDVTWTLAELPDREEPLTLIHQSFLSAKRDVGEDRKVPLRIYGIPAYDGKAKTLTVTNGIALVGDINNPTGMTTRTLAHHLTNALDSAAWVNDKSMTDYLRNIPANSTIIGINNLLETIDPNSLCWVLMTSPCDVESISVTRNRTTGEVVSFNTSVHDLSFLDRKIGDFFEAWPAESISGQIGECILHGGGALAWIVDEANDRLLDRELDSIERFAHEQGFTHTSLSELARDVIRRRYLALCLDDSTPTFDAETCNRIKVRPRFWKPQGSVADIEDRFKALEEPLADATEESVNSTIAEAAYLWSQLDRMTDEYGSQNSPALNEALRHLSLTIQNDERYGDTFFEGIKRNERKVQVRSEDLTSDDGYVRAWIGTLLPVPLIEGDEDRARRWRAVDIERRKRLGMNAPVLEDGYGVMVALNEAETEAIISTPPIDGDFLREGGITIHLRGTCPTGGSPVLPIVDFGDGSLTVLPYLSPYGRGIGYDAARETAVDILGLVAKTESLKRSDLSRGAILSEHPEAVEELTDRLSDATHDIIDLDELF